MKKNNLIRFFIILCATLYAIFLAFCLITLFFATNEREPDSYDKVKYFYREVECDKENFFEAVISLISDKKFKLDKYSIIEADMWMNCDGDIESLNLYYISTRKKYKIIKAHITADFESSPFCELEYMEYYKEHDLFYDYKDSDSIEITSALLFQSYNDVNARFPDGKEDEEFFVNLDGSGNMYVMTIQIKKDGGYSVTKVDDKIDDVWSTSYDQSINMGYLRHPFPLKS